MGMLTNRSPVWGLSQAMPEYVHLALTPDSTVTSKVTSSWRKDAFCPNVPSMPPAGSSVSSTGWGRSDSSGVGTLPGSEVEGSGSADDDDGRGEAFHVDFFLCENRSGLPVCVATDTS